MLFSISSEESVPLLDLLNLLLFTDLEAYMVTYRPK